MPPEPGILAKAIVELASEIEHLIAKAVNSV
jgi:hypothetical protein